MGKRRIEQEMEEQALIEKKNKLIEMRTSDKSYETIATELGLNIDEIISLASDIDVKTRIKSMKSFKRESAIEKLACTTGKRLELLGEILQKATTEIKRRDFSDMPTEKLIALIERLHKQLETSGVVIFQEESIFEDEYETEKELILP